MYVEVKDALTLMIAFGMFIIGLLTLIVEIALANPKQKEIDRPWSGARSIPCSYFRKPTALLAVVVQKSRVSARLLIPIFILSYPFLSPQC